MKNIIIFTSGQGTAAERVVSLFNEGNRIHINYVFTDVYSDTLQQALAQYGVKLVAFDTRGEENNIADILDIIKNENPELLVIDGESATLPDDIFNLNEVKIIRIDNPTEAPNLIVDALETINRDTVETPAIEIPEVPKTMDEEWAEALQINFDPSRIPVAPPPVPENEANENVTLNTQPPMIPEENRSQINIGTPPSGQYRNSTSYNQSPSQNYRNDRNEHQEPMPSTYLIWSVLFTIFCCFIPGIIAIVFSSQVSSKYFAGDIEGAKRASRNAEIWIIVSFVLGVLSATLYVPIMMIN